MILLDESFHGNDPRLEAQSWEHLLIDLRRMENLLPALCGLHHGIGDTRPEMP